jgi:hypothetical protein
MDQMELEALWIADTKAQWVATAKKHMEHAKQKWLAELKATGRMDAQLEVHQLEADARILAAIEKQWGDKCAANDSRRLDDIVRELNW